MQAIFYSGLRWYVKPPEWIRNEGYIVIISIDEESENLS